MHALGGKAIDMRRSDVRAPGKPERVLPELVDEHPMTFVFRIRVAPHLRACVAPYCGSWPLSGWRRRYPRMVCRGLLILSYCISFAADVSTENSRGGPARRATATTHCDSPRS